MSEDAKLPLPRSLQEIVGALLFASPVPLSVADLRETIRAVEPEPGDNAEVMEIYQTATNREVTEALQGLGKALEVAGCGFQLVETGGVWHLQTASACGRHVRTLLKLDRPNRLGRASLETLAIIAYRQPVTKSEIEQIRGVDVSGNLKTLMELSLVRLVGKSELPGHPFLYGTTPIFLEHFGLANLQQLNELDPTLQRSNPRLKAASYRRPEKTELELAAEEQAAAQAEAQAAAEAASGAPADAAAEAAEAEEALPPKDPDDFFIDDTPDEFDEDDDDDEEENEDGEAGEGEDDEES